MDDMVVVRTAAATLEELCMFEMCACSSGDGGDGGGDSNRDERNGGDPRTPGVEDDPAAAHALASGNLRALDARHRWFTVMLTDAYARSAGAERE